MIKINLLPKEMRKKKKLPIIDRTFIYGVAIIIVQIILFYIVSLGQQAKIADLEGDIATVQLELDKYREKIQLLNEAEQLKKELTARMDAVQELENQRPYWVQVLSDFLNVIPEFVWVENFSEKGTGVVSFSANGYTLKAIAAFLVNLVNSQSFTNVQVGPITQKVFSGGPGFGFTVTASLKEPPKTNLGNFHVDTVQAENMRKTESKGFVESTREKLGLYDKNQAKKMMGGFSN